MPALKTRALSLAASLVLAAMTAGAALAQMAPPDPARLAAAKDLVAAMGGEDQARASVTAFVDAINADLRQKLPQKAPALEAYLKTEAALDGVRVKDLLAGFQELAVNFYAERFTVDEMQAIAVFHKSAAGRKFQETTPRLMTLLAGRMQDFQGTLMRDLQGQLAK